MNIREWLKTQKEYLTANGLFNVVQELVLLEKALASGEIQTGIEWHDAVKDPPKEDMDVLIYIPKRGIIDAKYKTDVDKCLIGVCAIYPTHWAKINLPEEKWKR